ncbi:MAG: hypothetical protein L0387_00030 [Acidobacteria bacterium]|nr:hypothetical protein [Acidobacteriota bacterium]
MSKPVQRWTKAERERHLLGILAEECAEVAIRASKAQRFGMHEVQPGQRLNNRARLETELDDLRAVAEMLVCRTLAWRRLEKRRKVKKYMDYARRCRNERM